MPENGLWHFRVHYGDYDLVSVVDFIKSKAEVVVIVKEIDANRPHLHSVITHFNQSKSTFVQQFMKQFPLLRGNKSYSCSVKNDIEAQLRYCLKGESKETNPEVLYCKEGLNCKQYHEQYWEENLLLKAKGNTKYESGTVPASESEKPKAKVKSKTWTERVYDEIQSLFPTEILVIQTYLLIFKPSDAEKKIHKDSRRVIFRHMMKCFGQGVKKIGHRIIQETYDGIINAIIQQHSQAGEKYSDKMFDLIYPNFA